jgi:hypothetical protein
LKYFHLFLYLLLLITPEALSDSPTWYEVEILVFEHLTPNTRDLELTSLEPRLPTSEPIGKSPSAETHAPSQETVANPLPLPPRVWKLTDIAQHLNKSSHYRTLLHQAWKQIATAYQQAPSVTLRLPFPENTPGNPLDPQLEGSIILSRGRFLHLALDLLYRYLPPASMLPRPEEDSANSSLHVRLTQSRRIRIQELHYFDHPRFGVLAQVRQSAAPGANTRGGAPKTFPLEATPAEEIPPEEAGES